MNRGAGNPKTGGSISCGRRSRLYNVLFVGAFKTAAKDGAVGGQLFACRSLVASGITEHVNWITVDSTQQSVPPPRLVRRLAGAIGRLGRFFWELRRGDIDGALIFSSAGGSLLEKGVMAFASKLRGRWVIFAPRSGLILRDCGRSAFMRWFTRLVLRRVDVVLCQGERWREYYENLVPVDTTRFVVIKNWIEIDSYSDTPNGTGGRHPVIIVFLGWIERTKGVWDLIEAFADADFDQTKVRMVICGKGSQLVSIMERVRALGIEEMIEFRGWVTGSEKRETIQLADIFALPSYHEGLPNALLECMAAGKAVIASSVGSIPEVLDNGLHGLLITPGDRRALTVGLVELVNDSQLRRDLGSRARGCIEREHDVEMAWPRLFDVIEQLSQ